MEPEKRVFLIQNSGDLASHITVRYTDRTYAQEMFTHKYYRHETWDKGKADTDFGRVRKGDYVIQYCTANVEIAPKQIIIVYEVTGIEKITEDVKRALKKGQITNEEAVAIKSKLRLLRLKNLKHIHPPLSLDKIKHLIELGKLSAKMKNCGQYGFNICQVEMSDLDTVLNWWNI